MPFIEQQLSAEEKIVVKSSSLEKQAQSFMEDFEKSFGVGTLRRGIKKKKYETISTGSILLDVATGVGGYVRGRITQIWGPPDTGKTTAAFAACAEAQQANLDQMVAYIDVENKVDEEWADLWGVDRSRWFLYVPPNAEDTADAVKKFLSNPLFSMVVVDSIGAMIGRVEMEKKADEDTVAIVARICTRMVKHATSYLPQNNAVFIVINQPRANISKFGGSTELPGGWALKHCTTMSFQLRGTDKSAPAATIGGERIPVGRYTAIKVERNKIAPAGRVAVVLFNTVAIKGTSVGIDKPDEVFQVGDKLDIITRSGANYTLTDGTRHNGQAKTVEYLRAHSGVVEEIRRRAVAMHEAEVIEDEVPEVPDEPPEEEQPPGVDQVTGEVLSVSSESSEASSDSAASESESFFMEL
jgi:recombination protein RecA